MTREKKISEEATCYGCAVAYDCPERPYYSEGFKQGAKWADSHQWNSIEILPCYYPEYIHSDTTVRVFARTSHGKFLITRMEKENDTWKWACGCEITHWMPIPKLPK